MFSIAICLGMLAMLRAEAVQQPTPADLQSKTLAPGDAVLLTDADLTEITLRVLEARPMLSSSPGIKAADAYRAYPSGDSASVIFFPHADSGGVKQAFQVQCERDVPDGAWRCPYIGIRRYMQVEGQDFETRVRAGIGSDVARTLIDATRSVARAGAAPASPPLDTAIMIIEVTDHFLVAWGSGDGQYSVSVQARLRQGGNPRDAQDWETVLEQTD